MGIQVFFTVSSSLETEVLTDTHYKCVDEDNCIYEPVEKTIGMYFPTMGFSAHIDYRGENSYWSDDRNGEIRSILEEHGVEYYTA